MTKQSETKPGAEIQPIVIGTAGHIDHGKSTLVRALTGIDPDRLKEEKERGLTIDLGFAPLDLPDGRKVGIVDVPGHERFIRNMVAGASGIDLVVLVVAADDGVMPQTREHMAIMQMLGVGRGLIALTKIDAVDPELVELAVEDVTDAVRGTFLEDAPLFRVSALRGEGMDAFKTELFRMAAETTARSDQGIFRMPVQRVFSARGFGTIVTGIPVSGRVSVGDVLEVLPGGFKGKVRGLQAYKEATDQARAGHSTAINLTDVDHHQVTRGHVVGSPGYFQPFNMLGIRLTALPDLERPITNRMPVRLHTGTAEAVGEVVLLDHEELARGETGLAQLRLEEPVVCAPGDAFVLRLASPALTLGGGVVLEESQHRLKRFKGFVIDELTRQSASLSSPLELLEVILSRSRAKLWATEELSVAIKSSRAETSELLAAASDGGQVISPGSSGRWMHRERLEELVGEVVAAIEAWFEEQSHRVQIDVRTLRSATRLDHDLLDTLLEELVQRGVLERVPGGLLTLVGRSVQVDPETARLRECVLAALEAAGLKTPSPEELVASVGAKLPSLQAVLELLVDQGEIERIGKDLFVARVHLQRAREEVVKNCERNGQLEIPELRDALGTTRKYLIPLLEHFDKGGLTLRQGGHRVLKRR